jgi:hypothetical protein
MDDPLVWRVLATHPDLAAFGRWSIMPMAAVTRDRCRIHIAYDDARFALLPGRGRLGRSVALPTGAPGCPSGA